MHEKCLLTYTSFNAVMGKECFSSSGKSENDNYGFSIYLYKYNSNHNLTEESLFDKSGGLVSLYNNSYDVNGNMITRDHFGSDNTFQNDNYGISKYRYLYDNNNLIEEHHYKSDGNLIRKFYP